MTTAFLIPKPGLRVRIPGTRGALPPQGARVELTSYWRRRVADGDAVAGAPPRNVPTKPATRAARRGAQE